MLENFLLPLLISCDQQKNKSKYWSISEIELRMSTYLTSFLISNWVIDNYDQCNFWLFDLNIGTFFFFVLWHHEEKRNNKIAAIKLKKTMIKGRLPLPIKNDRCRTRIVSPKKLTKLWYTIGDDEAMKYIWGKKNDNFGRTFKMHT